MEGNTTEWSQLLNLGGGAIIDFLPNFCFYFFAFFSPVLFTEHALLLYWENLIQKIVSGAWGRN